MKKVLFIVHQMNKGGLECRLMDIIRNWNCSEIVLDIFTTSLDKGFFDDEVINRGSKIYYNPKITIYNMAHYVYYFKQFLLLHPEYQIIHAYQDAWCGVFCKGAKKAGVPVRIAHSRTANNRFSIKDIVRNMIKISAKKYATHYFAVSGLAGKWLFGEHALEQGRVIIWPNAIDSCKFLFNPSIRNDVRKNLGLKNKSVIMHVGNFTPSKNHHFILEIFQCLCKKNNKAILVLVGTGNVHKYQKIAKKLQISDKVLFLNSRDDVDRLLQAADVFLFPSIFEGLPGAVLEAQAAGLPCIVSENVTHEVKITPLVEFVSLRKEAEEWATIVCSSLDCPRQNTLDYFIKSGFDINILIGRLKEFYNNA